MMLDTFGCRKVAKAKLRNETYIHIHDSKTKHNIIIHDSTRQQNIHITEYSTARHSTKNHKKHSTIHWGREKRNTERLGITKGKEGGRW